jgi:hypothetical protein
VKSDKESSQIHINPEYKIDIKWEEAMKKEGITHEKIRLADEFDITILKKILKDVKPNRLKFYIGSFTSHVRYFLMIPYKDDGITKYFFITFASKWRPWEDMSRYCLQIGDFGIFNNTAKR